MKDKRPVDNGKEKDDVLKKEGPAVTGDIEKVRKERDEYYEKYIRALAEFYNARKRIEKEKTDFIRFANESIISELFPILDSFDKAIESIEKSANGKAFLEGLKMLQDKFHKVLETNGLSVMNSLGEKFDPIKHEAVMKVHSDEHDDGVIVEEFRRGYLLNGRVIRPAMVKVVVKDDGTNKE